MVDETYSGWKNWDSWATYLWATNDSDVYNSTHVPWVKNIKKKLDSGKYDHATMVPAIKKYWGARVLQVAKKGGDDIDPKKIDWDEITTALEGEAREY